LKEPLKPEHIKDRLLGHWGTCPGLSLVYAHCNLIIKKYQQSMIYVCGPGHGAPAVLANLYVGAELKMFYPEYNFTYQGLSKLIK
jgi:xylulose-5-phosphate/fructose-6-phosphate phosphoketolase